MAEIDELSELLADRDADGCAEWLKRSQGLEAVRVVARLGDADRESLLALLEPADAADVLENLPEPQQVDALEDLLAEVLG